MNSTDSRLSTRPTLNCPRCCWRRVAATSRNRGIDSSGLELLAHTVSQILTDYQPEACGKNISSIKQSLGGEIKYSFDKGVV